MFDVSKPFLDLRRSVLVELAQAIKPSSFFIVNSYSLDPDKSMIANINVFIFTCHSACSPAHFANVSEEAARRDCSSSFSALQSTPVYNNAGYKNSLDITTVLKVFFRIS